MEFVEEANHILGCIDLSLAFFYSTDDTDS
jgi:hypothetical protein